jgi:UDP-N-acetylmuramate dehydrogenase
MVIEPSNAANRSVGSFFVNPVITREHFARIEARDASIPHYPMGASEVKVPAAWLIERAGFPKGFSRGVIGVSPFQAQAIINQGGASAADVIALATDIKRAVWNTFSISLVPEPVFVGFPPSPELRWLIESPSQGGESVRAIRG